MWSIYRKFAIIGLLLGCTFFIAQSESVVTARSVAPCYEECDSNLNACRDECEDECDEESTNSACGYCIIACQNQWLNCMSYAVSCQGETVQPGRCTVVFGRYCEKDPYGWADCTSNPSTNFYHYSTKCNIFGQENAQCVNCPGHPNDNDTCENPNHLPPCS